MLFVELSCMKYWMRQNKAHIHKFWLFSLPWKLLEVDSNSSIQFIKALKIYFVELICIRLGWNGDISPYGPLAPGLTSHSKFADDFLKTCAVSHPSFITYLGWGWFCSSIYQLLARFCTQKIVRTFFFGQKCRGEKNDVK